MAVRGIRVRIKGDKELIAKLRKVPGAMDEVRDRTSRNVGNATIREMITKTIPSSSPPIRTASGRLTSRSSWQTAKLETGKWVVRPIGPAAAYAAGLNFGKTFSNLGFMPIPGKGKQGEGYLVPLTDKPFLRPHVIKPRHFADRARQNIQTKTPEIADRQLKRKLKELDLE